MPTKSPFTWKPTDVIEVTNASAENILLDLDSGHLRLDVGRTVAAHRQRAGSAATDLAGQPGQGQGAAVQAEEVTCRCRTPNSS